MKKKYKKIYIEITNKCNLNCTFCSEVKRKKEKITLENFEEIIKKINNYTDYIYLHVKGEPLLHPEIDKILDIAEKYNLKVNLTTNGTLFPNVVDKIKDKKALHKINFSLHSENNYKNYLENIFENVKKLSTDTVVIYRLWTLNNNELDKKSQEIVEKIKNFYNLDEKTYKNLKTKNNIKISSTIYVDKDNEFTWPDNIENELSPLGYCHALKTHIAILVDGTVVPCCLDSNASIPLGNIYDNTLEEIINNERYKNLQKSFQNRKPCESLCRRCTFKDKFKKYKKIKLHLLLKVIMKKIPSVKT